MQAGQQTLLLVEDDPLVRMTLVEGLTDAGYRVLEAEDAEAALNLLARQPEIDVLLTDINLPGTDGFDLAHAARQLRPRLPVLYASGRFRAAEPGRGLPGAPFLAKPFSVARAAEVIGKLLG